MQLGAPALTPALALAFAGLVILSSPAQSQVPFADQLVLDPQETCSTGIPEEAAVVALALRGAKDKNYLLAGRNEIARLAVRGPASDAYSVFQITGTASAGAMAFFGLGHERFVQIGERSRVFASAEAAGASLFVLEDAGQGYFRVRQQGSQIWMRMNANGYLDFNARSAAEAVNFCAQKVAAN